MAKLRAIRQEQGFSIEALAARAGVGASTLIRIEHGTTRPRPSVVRRISAALGVAPVRIDEFRQRAGCDGKLPTVLVVDDEYEVRTLVVAVLEEEGYDVISAADGIEALALLDGKGADLVLTDLWMPRMDGHTLIQRLREAGWPVQIIVMSALHDQPLVPGIPLVPKPFDIDQLLSVLSATHDR
jgi:CheY-like chemotaxis protein